MKKIIFFLFGPISALAAGDDCKIQGSRPELVTKIAGSPSYFAKIGPEGKYMYFIQNGRNIIMDLKDPATRLIVPGPYDPVPAPPTGPDMQSAHVTVPDGGMKFFNTKEVFATIKPGETIAPVILPKFTDLENNHSYQSVGVLKDKETENPTYRVLSGSLNIVDYDTKTTPWKKLNSRNRICGGAEGRFQLPMLSKDGREISVYDTQEGVTKIMAVNDNGTCKEKLNLGFATGKSEFNYQGNQITFHVDSTNEGLGKQFRSMPAGMTKNVFTLDLVRDGDKLKPGALRRLTNNTENGTGSYYPSYTLDGRVAYIHAQRNTRDNTVAYSFQVINPENSRSSTALLMEGDDVDCTKVRAATFALGSLFVEVCKGLRADLERLGGTEAALTALSLDPAACKRMVNQYWERNAANVKQDAKILRTKRVTASHMGAVTKEAVAAACPGAQVGGTASVYTSPDAAVPMEMNRSPKQLFETYCRSCHIGGQAKKYDWDNLSGDDLNRMLIAIQDGSMPKDGLENRVQVMRPMVLELESRIQTLEDAKKRGTN